ncbi:hypothetical protein E2C01_036123 [Portunus trituberculatus]|uniref:Uncharacterized protein n=1 Tax=Portunus trituberculatus TaxID=210409 RepID=A0A5B7F5Z8_PORTR|nr:hypothetical protein [Portunus trituberculatus]
MHNWGGNASHRRLPLIHPARRIRFWATGSCCGAPELVWCSGYIRDRETSISLGVVSWACIDVHVPVTQR